ncbi:MAG: aminotransferase class I/II-fold pyridoxal phosphate-dependent enzyme [Desulfobacterota bacterium]|nr:aminotransferase class I/II-fold pyridoxal phosphate-dependent enzyme [Thermodesulfobacteriota bacterium]
MSRFNRRVEQIPPSGIRRFFDLVLDAKDIISLGVGEPDFVTPWQVREQVFYALEQGRTSYTSNWGITELRQETATYLNTRFGTRFDRDEILITVGVSEGIDLVLRTILNEGDELILPEPTYVCYRPLTELAGGVVRAVSTPSLKVTADAIERAVTPTTKAILLSYPCNPTGYTIDKTEILKIGEIVRKKGIWLISDEIYAELTYEGEHFSVGALPGLKEQVIVLNGFSKAFAMTGWRLGYIAASRDFLTQAVKIHQYAALCAPIMAQYGALESLRRGIAEMEEMKKSYWRRRNYMYDALNSIGLSVAKPEGAFYIFPSIHSTGKTSEEFAVGLLEQEKVAVVPGDVFGMGGEGHVRICYATDFNLLKESVRRIDRYIKAAKK